MESKVFVRGEYNYDMDTVSRETGLECLDVSLAVQSEKDDCDINTIVRRFGLTGSLPQGARVPQYADFVGAVDDYRTALDLLREADESFMKLPADIRKEFNNDAGKLVEFVSDERNRRRAEELGLVVGSAVKLPSAAIASPVPGSSEGSSTGST